MRQTLAYLGQMLDTRQTSKKNPAKSFNKVPDQQLPVADVDRVVDYKRKRWGDIEEICLEVIELFHISTVVVT